MMNSLDVHFNQDVNRLLIAGILEFSNLQCQAFHPDLWQQSELLQRHYREKYKTPSDALPELRAARELYHAVGIEPTRIRPSSEALLRRIIKGKALYQINSIVDVCNYASLYFLLPIGLYDLAKLESPVEFRFGLPGEEYQGIGKESVHVGGRLTLADRLGPFGNPSSDSLRTSIDFATTQVMMVIFAPYRYPRERLRSHMDFAGEAMLRFHPGGQWNHAELIETALTRKV